jgi:hypothetical protein
MFAYILITLELSILYSVFWYYFLRDSKQYKVSGPLWGVYEDRPDELIDRQNSDCALIFSKQGVRFVDNKKSSAPSTDDPHRPQRPCKGNGKTDNYKRAA